MAGSRKLPVAFIGLGLSLAMILNATEVAEAGSSNYLGEFSGGVSAILDAGATNTAEVLMTTARELNIDLNVPSKDDKSTLVMANVSSALNVREEPDAESAKAGMLYKDCGGTILERKDGWTKIQSGNLVGWANDEFLLFGEEAEALASEVGITLARTEDGLNVRKEPARKQTYMVYFPRAKK